MIDLQGYTHQMNTINKSEIIRRLQEHNILLTQQRIQIAQVLFDSGEHLSADEILRRINKGRGRVSKATVYNTLHLFAEKGLVLEVTTDPNRIYYDPNNEPHHHFYDAEEGMLVDIPYDAIKVECLPELPKGKELQGIDVVIRVKDVNTVGADANT